MINRPQYCPTTGRPLPESGASTAVRLVRAVDWYIDAPPGYVDAALAEVRGLARAAGLQEMDFEYCRPDILDDGTMRIYLEPVDASEQDAFLDE